MNKIFLILAAAIFLPCCTGNVGTDCPGADKPKYVEIAISTQGGSLTRTPVPDPGNAEENRIDELDLLVFGADGLYLYRREASRVSGELNTYRASLVETDQQLTIHLLANCRDIIKDWEGGAADKSQMKWSGVHAKLIDTEPWRLTRDSVSLPMWGTVTGRLATESSPTRLGTVEMLRSVASVDVYVEQSGDTAGFMLSDLYLYYAPDMGYVGAVGKAGSSPAQYLIPDEMTTTLNNIAGKELHANSVGQFNPVEGGKQYDMIAHQMYLCENDAVDRSGARRPTRVIIAGNYTRSGNLTPGAKRYYPIDIVDAKGYYRPVIRNWKYEFIITSVSGPGHATIEEAAEAAQTDLNVRIIEWNREEVEIGISGRYYVSMERKAAVLWRDAGSTDRLKLTYRIEEAGSGEFGINFKEGSANGIQQTIDGGIKNDYFSVTMAREGSDTDGAIVFTVTALKPYAAGHDTDVVEIAFRNLRFELSITQLDSTPGDWENGGTIPVNF